MSVSASPWRTVRVYRSNRMEVLSQQLAEVLRHPAAAGDDHLLTMTTRDVVVVHSQVEYAKTMPEQRILPPSRQIETAALSTPRSSVDAVTLKSQPSGGPGMFSICR